MCVMWGQCMLHPTSAAIFFLILFLLLVHLSMLSMSSPSSSASVVKRCFFWSTLALIRVCIVYQFTFDIINVRYPFLFVVFNQLGCKRVTGTSHSPTTCILQYSLCISITACPDSSLCHSSVPTCTIVVWTAATLDKRFPTSLLSG